MAPLGLVPSPPVLGVRTNSPGACSSAPRSTDAASAGASPSDSAKYAAPGGGKVGMRAAELQKLYNNALQASPHKYTDGKYLSIAASGIAPTKLVFETDAQGVVTEWRVGLLPEVDYVEGCS